MWSEAEKKLSILMEGATPGQKYRCVCLNWVLAQSMHRNYTLSLLVPLVVSSNVIETVAAVMSE